MFARTPVTEKALRIANPFRGLRLLADAIEGARRASVPAQPIPHEYARILRILAFITEVMNGTLVQYFWNSSGDHAAALEHDLAIVGCDDLLAAVAAARIEVFDGAYPVDINARRRAIERFFHTHPFNDDDDAERLAQLTPSPLCDRATDLLRTSGSELPRRALEWAARNSTSFDRLR